MQFSSPPVCVFLHSLPILSAISDAVVGRFKSVKNKRRKLPQGRALVSFALKEKSSLPLSLDRSGFRAMPMSRTLKDLFYPISKHNSRYGPSQSNNIPLTFATGCRRALTTSTRRRPAAVRLRRRSSGRSVRPQKRQGKVIRRALDLMGRVLPQHQV